MFTIEWKGDTCKNYYSDRRGLKPMAICNHITAGTASSAYYWFTDPKNTQSSSHFVVRRDGGIDQYVALEHGAWTQGISPDRIPFATTPIIRHMNCDPNYYVVSIEHEGYEDQEGNNFGLDGTLTEEQFYASCWLHKYIQEEVERRWGVHITLGTYNVFGHFQVDPKRKPFCPGPNFPWGRMYAELSIAERLTLEEYTERLSYVMSKQEKVKQAYAVKNRIDDLYTKAQDSDSPWSNVAYDKLMMVQKFMVDNDLINP